MCSLSRRNFLGKSATALAAAQIGASSVWAKPMGSNHDIRIGIVGVGIKGRMHVQVFREMKGVRIAAICDVDQARLDKESEGFKELNQRVKTYKDIRNLLEDKEIDAVVIATPHHWHALMTIWACQAGKDVYVEKPVSHDIWESMRMLDAQKKYGRLVQVGTQRRSNTGFQKGLEYLRSGALGEMQWVHGVFYKYRKSIGRRRGPQRIPSSVDYNLFQGPAAIAPLIRKKLHYDWHWQWETGNGDMGNNGAHSVDNVRQIMGDDRQPNKVMSIGGRFDANDDGETPNVHLAYLDYGDIPAFAEIRGIPYKPDAGYTENLRGSRESVIVQCERGYMTMGQGAMAYTNDRKRIEAFPGNDMVVDHAVNFIDAVRQQDARLLNCPLQVAVQAGEIFHMANLSYRSGLPATVDEIAASMGGVEPAIHALGNIQENLERLGVDLLKEPITLGSWMSLEDSGSTLKVHHPDSNLVAQALFEKRRYRRPFVVPSKV